jgi:soluble lytic murein transglycosylase
MVRLLVCVVLLAAWTVAPSGTLRADSSPLDQATLLVRRGEYSAADQLYGRVADQLGAEAPRARLLQARAALADGRTNDAEALLQRQFSEFPGSDQETAGLFTLEQVRRAADDCRGALRALDAYQASLAGAADPLGPYTPLQRAQCSAQLGDWSTELLSAQQALAIEAGGPRLTRIEAYERFAEAALKLGRKQDALDAYNQNLALAGTRGYTAEMLFTSATIAHALGQDALAADRFRAVVVDYPETARAPGALDALADLGWQATVSPYQAGLVRFNARDDSHAAGLFEQVDPASPDAGPAHLKHAAALLRLGQTADALQELQATAEAYSAESGSALLQLGQAYERDGRYTSAEDAYTRMGQLAPDRLPEALYHGGLSRYLRSDVDGAIAAWRQALASGGSVSNPLRAQILFWKAKALVAQGIDPAEAREALDQAAAASPDSYYGLRAWELGAGLSAASARPGLTALLSLTPKEVAERDTWLVASGTTFEQAAADVASAPELGRADILLQAGLRTEASWEIDAVTRRYVDVRDVAHLSALADWLALRDLPHLSLLVARAERELVGLGGLPRAFQKQVFPAGWADLVVEEANRYGLDPLLVLAVARQESSFDPRARSGADARGLMQVVPATARYIADRLGRSDDFSLTDLYKPSLSLEFGSWFLQRLLGDYTGSVFPALVAYNAGGGNLSRWVSRWGDDPDVLVEEIPFAETQNYVRTAYSNYLEYRLLYGTS